MKIKTKIRKVIRALPTVDEAITKAQLRRKFDVEISILENRHKNACQLRSIIHFSVNKAATQYIKGVLQKISWESGLVPVSLHEYAFSTNMPFLDHLSFEEMERYKHVFKPRGYLYSVFGGMIKNIDDLEKYNVVLSIRDPRDILTSKYYSVAFSHAVPPLTSDKRLKFLKHRDWVKSTDIDTYVLQESKKVLSVFEAYKVQLLEKYSNVVLMKYEDMIQHYGEWLDELTAKCGLRISSQLRNDLELDFQKLQVRKENKNAHLRKGIAGDYLEKLSPNTIKKINSQYAELLNFYGYEI